MPVTNNRQPKKCPDPGFHPNVPEEDYHLMNAVNASLLKENATPHEMRAWLEGEPIQPTAAMYYGRALDAGILDRARYATQKHVVPGLRPAAISKTFMKAAADHPGKVILAEEEWEESIEAAYRTCNRLPDVRRALFGDEELCRGTMLVADDISPDGRGTGLRMRILPDRISTDRRLNYLTDLKSTSAESPHAFMRDAWNRGYDIQLAFYRHVCRRLGPSFPDLPWQMQLVVVQNKPPFDVWLWMYDDKWEQLAVQRMQSRLAMFAHALATDRWDGHGNENGTVVLTPEMWMWNQYFHQDA